MNNKMQSSTESDSNYNHLEKMPVAQLLAAINAEDKTVPLAVENTLPQIENLVNAIVPKMKAGGRLFYIGAGTSGRLGIVDASECPPTFGVSHDLVIGLIAGGDKAIRFPVEFAEDDVLQGWADLQSHSISPLDVVVGIAASGRTPYVAGALQQCRAAGITTGCIVCNTESLVARHADWPVEIIVGAEFVTGSTRMKSGTAQKLALNMISTAVMIQLGRVRGNKMVDMQLTNHKLVGRGTRMVMQATGLAEAEANALLLKHGSVRKAIDAHQS
ncbi:MAG: N-acetylmuramic acid 6-phosphate etherase [Flavobacteriales bacterium]